MNIRDAEVETGLTRANIRYYENAGLVSPKRQENGYRDYTAENIETLKRIKLLRLLDIPIEEIERLQKDEQSLAQVLSARLREAKQEEQKLREQQRICVMMRDDGISYQSLCADYYLSQFGRSESSLVRTNDPVEKDQEYQYPYSWRRYFARLLDSQFCTLLFNGLCYLGLRIMPVEERWFDILALVVSLVAMYVLEPVFLHFFAATPGKWLLGIRVYHVDGRKLTISEGRQRTGNVLFYGMGLNIPVFSWYRLWKSYRADQDGERLPWDCECDSSVEIEPPRARHKILGLGAVGLTFLVIMWLVIYGMSPINKGNLTAAELAENMNRYMDYYDIYTSKMLDKNCQWTDKPSYGTGTVIVVGGVQGMPRPVLDITEEGGYVSEVSFTVHAADVGFGHGYQDFVQVMMLAYGGAQSGVNVFELSKMQKLITENKLNDFSAEIGGIQFTYTISYNGFGSVNANSAYPLISGDEKGVVDVYFSMKKVR